MGFLFIPQLEEKQMTRVTITLQADEKDTPRRLAVCERRDLRAHAGRLIRSELEKRGLLPAGAAADDLGREVSSNDRQA